MEWARGEGLKLYGSVWLDASRVLAEKRTGINTRSGSVLSMLSIRFIWFLYFRADKDACTNLDLSLACTRSSLENGRCFCYGISLPDLSFRAKMFFGVVSSADTVSIYFTRPAIMEALASWRSQRSSFLVFNLHPHYKNSPTKSSLHLVCR